MTCVNILPKQQQQEGGTPWHLDATAPSVAESEVEILTFTVPASTTRTIERIIGTACCEGVFQLKDGIDILATFATTPSNFTKEFKFDPGLPIASGKTIKLFFTANEDSPVVDVYGHVMGRDQAN